jgi:type IV pilus assembly protein PilM
VLDVEAFALVNAYELNYPQRTDALTAIVHVGRSATNVCLLDHSQLVFTRDISVGGALHADALKRELNVDDATAERIERGQIPPEVNHDHATRVLRDATGQLVLEIRKTIDFYRATASVGKLTKVVLSGGAWQAEGLIDLLTTEFDAPVDVFDPFRKITRAKGAIGGDVAGPAYSIAVGLALRTEGDR